MDVKKEAIIEMEQKLLFALKYQMVIHTPYRMSRVRSCNGVECRSSMRCCWTWQEVNPSNPFSQKTSFTSSKRLLIRSFRRSEAPMWIS